MSKKSVVFGGESVGSGGRWFRADIPARALKGSEWSAQVANYVLVPERTDRDQRLSGWDGWEVPPGLWNEGVPLPIIKPPAVMTLRVMDEVDISNPLPRIDRIPLADSIRQARDQGQVILYDVDDDIWHIPDWSPAKKAMHGLIPSTRAYDLDVIDANICACDGVIVSTPHLGEVIQERFGAVPIYLQRPGIDPSEYRTKEPDKGRPLRVGWMGSMSHHFEHIQTIFQALEILKKYDAEFWHLGKIKNDDAENLLKISAPIHHLPWGRMPDLPAKLAQVDIGIIPRWPSKFNEGQSVTSGLQFACAGIPFLVSPSDEYLRAEDLGIGTVCYSIDDWVNELECLLKDTFYRLHTAKYSRLAAIGHFGLEPTRRRYVEMLDGLVDGE